MKRSTAPTRRSLAKRAQIMRAARALFLLRGFAQTSMDAITAEAGVSKQTLYSYFESKPQLLAAVVAHELDGLPYSSPPQSPTDLESLRARLLGFASAMADQMLQPDALALLRLLVSEVAHVPELRPLARDTVLARLFATIGALLAQAHARGIIDAPSPELGARMLVGPMMSFVVFDGLLGSGAPTPPPAATIERLVDLFLRTVSQEGRNP